MQATLSSIQEASGQEGQMVSGSPNPTQRLIARPRKTRHPMRKRLADSPAFPPSPTASPAPVDAKGQVQATRLVFPTCASDLYSIRRTELVPLRKQPFVPFNQQSPSPTSEKEGSEKRKRMKRRKKRETDHPETPTADDKRESSPDKRDSSPDKPDRFPDKRESSTPHEVPRSTTGMHLAAPAPLAKKQSLTDMNLNLPCLAQALAADSRDHIRGTAAKQTAMDRSFTQLKQRRLQNRNKRRHQPRIRPLSPLASAAAQVEEERQSGGGTPKLRALALKKLHSQMVKEDSAFHSYLRAGKRHRSRTVSPSPRQTPGISDTE